MKKKGNEDFGMTKNEYRKELGLRIRQFRKELRLRQDELASELNFGRSNLARIEKGAVYPSIFALNVFKTKYNLSLDWLLYNEGVMFCDTVSTETAHIDHCAEELMDLRYCMQNSPQIKHAVLGFYLEYKAERSDIIHALLKNMAEENRQE